MKKLLLVILTLGILSGGGVAVYKIADSNTTERTSNRTKGGSPEAIKPRKEFGKTKYSLTDTDSIWLIVSKEHKLDSDYEASDLTLPDVALENKNPESELRVRKEVAEATEEMFDEAKKEGINLQLSSGYRPYTTQKRFYDNVGGERQNLVAPPGASEHQSGLAIDIRGENGACRIELCFKDEPEGKWLAANAHKYGFILRYPEGKADVTGYNFEPWHFRYVGKELASEMKEQGISTLEEFFDL